MCVGLLIFFVYTQTYDGSFSETLQLVQVAIVDQKKCVQEMSNNVTGRITTHQFCAGGGKGDACIGDSGGPLVLNYKLIGIVSWGFECGTVGQYGVYTFVASQRKWIWKEMKLLTDAELAAN